jgi:Tol biopolymer transport system component
VIQTPPVTHTPTATQTLVPPTFTFTPVPPTPTPTSTDTPTVQPPAPALQIAFFSDRDTPGYGEIYLMNPDGSGQTRLSSDLRVPEVMAGSGPGVTSFDWSPASKQFFYSQGSGSQLYSVSADGKQKTLLKSPAGFFAISPNGQRIALMDLGATPPQIGVMGIDGGGYTQLTNDPDYQLGHPTWSPDGNRIAFSRSFAYWVIDAKGGEPSLLVPAELIPNLYECFWSPGGRHLACNTLTSTPVLYIVDINTQGASKLTDEGGWAPMWSPDGSQIAFYRDQVWVINTDGSGLRQLTSEGHNCNPIWVTGP